MTRPHPRNVEALLDWYRENKPHDLVHVEAVLEADALGASAATTILGFALQAFEAGRVFQSRNPELPLGGGVHYIVQEMIRELEAPEASREEEPDAEESQTAGGG